VQNIDLKLSFEPHSIQNLDSVLLAVGCFSESVIVLGPVIVLNRLDKEV
jgi:hypothetical protein